MKNNYSKLFIASLFVISISFAATFSWSKEAFAQAGTLVGEMPCPEGQDCAQGGSGFTIIPTPDLILAVTCRVFGFGCPSEEGAAEAREEAQAQRQYEQDEAERAVKADAERRRAEAEAQRNAEQEQRAEQYRQSTEGKSGVQLSPGAFLPSGESTQQGGQATTFDTNKEGKFQPSVVGDPVDVFSGRPVLEENLGAVTIYNRDTWQWEIDGEEYAMLDKFIYYSGGRPEVNNIGDAREQSNFVKGMSLIYAVPGRSTVQMISKWWEAPQVLSQDANQVRLQARYWSRKPALEATTEVVWRKDGAVNLMSASIEDSVGNVRRFTVQPAFADRLYVSGDPCWSERGGVTMSGRRELPEFSPVVRVLSSITNANGGETRISYEDQPYQDARFRNIPQRFVQRIQHPSGQVITIERRYFWKGPYENLVGHWYEHHPAMEGEECGYYRGNPLYLSCDDRCIGLYGTLVGSSSLLPDECYRGGGRPAWPACMAGERRPLAQGGALGVGEPPNWVYVWDRTGEYFYLRRSIVDRVVVDHAVAPRRDIFTFHYTNEGGDQNNVKTSRPLLEYVERKGTDGVSWFKQKYRYRAGGEVRLASIEDATGRTLVSWSQTPQNGGIHAEQRVGGDQATPIVYSIAERGLQSTVQKAEGSSMTFEKDGGSGMITGWSSDVDGVRIGEQTEYEPWGGVKVFHLPDGRRVEYEYEEQPYSDRPTSIVETSADGRERKQWSYEYNARGLWRNVSFNGELKASYQYCYEMPAGRCPCNSAVALAEIRYPDGTSEQIVPDKYGRALEYKDRSGLITRYYYEPFPTERECRAAYGVLGR